MPRPAPPRPATRRNTDAPSSLVSLLSHDKDRFGAVNLLLAEELPEAGDDRIGRVHAA